MLTVQYKEVYPYPHYDDEYAKLLQVESFTKKTYSKEYASVFITYMYSKRQI